MKIASILSIVALTSVVVRTDAADLFEAGKGDYHPPFLFPSTNNTSNINFTRFENYLRVSVVSWYINKNSSFWTDQMACGTCETTLGSEAYSIGIGTFELANGTYTAPIFEKPVIENRLWVDGSLTIKVFLKANKKDTVLATVLKDMAASSLGIASTTVEGYAVDAASGPYAPLVAAGKTLMTSVQSLLSTGPKPLAIFDLGTGFDITIPLTSLKGEDNFLLLVRGNPNLQKDFFRIDEDGLTARVMYNNQPFKDGAWMLLKVSNKTVYGRLRPWEQEAIVTRSRINTEMLKFKANAVTTAVMLSQLNETPMATRAASVTVDSPKTLGDRVRELNDRIINDNALSSAERGVEQAKNFTVWLLALRACNSNNPSLYFEGIAEMRSSMTNGVVPMNSVVNGAFRNAFANAARTVSTNASSKTEKEIWNATKSLHRENSKKNQQIDLF